MTEIERLIKEKFIDEDFLIPEERCSYKIDSNTKKVWAIQLELLSIFINVCNSHNLKYFASGGTLLGAIRHSGYIPWDDDIDVKMPREDYDILLKNPQWFKNPVELHVANNEEKYFESWARIHNVNTAVLYDNYKKEGSKQGIYIDVFPMDYYNGTKSELRVIKKIWNIGIIGHAFTYNVNKNIFLKFLSFICRSLKLFNACKMFNKINVLAKNNDKKSKYFLCKVVHVYSIEKQCFNVEWYSKSLLVNFEFLKINVPLEYDIILSKTYGNYRMFPPKEKRGNWHNFIFDCDNSYKKFHK